MIGTSYEGTLPLAAATTGVQGLEVVVPVSPNTSYYHYYRSNGLVRSPGGYLGEDVDVLYDFIASGDSTGRANCERIWKNGIFAGATGQDRATGDYNDFWSKRDLLPYREEHQGGGAARAWLQRLQRRARAQRAHLRRDESARACRCRSISIRAATAATRRPTC